MGAYLYEQTAKRFKVVLPSGEQVEAAEVKYYTKPYWDLWYESHFHRLSPFESRLMAQYRRKKAHHAKQTPLDYVVRTGDGKHILYRWEQGKGCTLFADDDAFGKTLKKVGHLEKRRFRWQVAEKQPEPLKGSGLLREQPAQNHEDKGAGHE